MKYNHPGVTTTHPGVKVMCCQIIVVVNFITILFPKIFNPQNKIMVRSQSSRKSTNTLKGSRSVRLNPEILKRMVQETIVSRHGTTSIGFPRYVLNSSALNSLQQAAENFLTRMWNEVHDIEVYKNHRSTVERQDFQEWRRKNISVPKKPKLIGGKTLCQLFESIKKKRRRPRYNLHHLGKSNTQFNKKPLTIHLQQLYFDQTQDEFKTVEARPYYPSYREYSEGDRILFTSPSGEELLVRIEKKSWYPNFECMLRSETVEACLPGVRCGDMCTAVNIYHNFRNNTYESLAKEYGVIAFKIKQI